MAFIYTYKEHTIDRLVHQNKKCDPKYLKARLPKVLRQNESNHLSDYVMISATYFYQYLYKIPHLILFR